MWVFLNDAFLSIVRHREKPDHFMVRSRVKGDIERVFPLVKAKHTPRGDYAYRAEILRCTVEEALARRLRDVNYDNFKDSVRDPDRHDFYLRVWGVMFQMQRWWMHGRRGKVRRPLPRGE